MSLVKKPAMTPRKLAATRRNQKLSHGPATAAGRERIHAAHLRHGFYSRAEGVALRALGENPEDFKDLLQRLIQTWSPADALQEELIKRLARALWRMGRADRMQEGLALRQAHAANRGRQAHFAERLVSLSVTSAGLQSLAGKVAQPGYATTSADLKLMEHLRQIELKETAELPLALFEQLRKPGSGDAESEEGVPEPDSDAKISRVMTRVRSIFGLPPISEAEIRANRLKEESAAGGALASGGAEESQQAAGAAAEGGDEAPAAAPPAEDPERAKVRQFLAFFLERLAVAYQDRCHGCMVEAVDGPSAYDRAAELAPTSPQTGILLRIEEASFRQVWRLTNLLVKMKHEALESESLETPAA